VCSSDLQMDLQERVQYWLSINPDRESCREAERQMLSLNSQDEVWIEARMQEFEQVLANASGTESNQQSARASALSPNARPPMGAG